MNKTLIFILVLGVVMTGCAKDDESNQVKIFGFTTGVELEKSGRNYWLGTKMDDPCGDSSWAPTHIPNDPALRVKGPSWMSRSVKVTDTIAFKLPKQQLGVNYVFMDVTPISHKVYLLYGYCEWERDKELNIIHYMVHFNDAFARKYERIIKRITKDDVIGDLDCKLDNYIAIYDIAGGKQRLYVGDEYGIGYPRAGFFLIDMELAALNKKEWEQILKEQQRRGAIEYEKKVKENMKAFD